MKNYSVDQIHLTPVPSPECIPVLTPEALHFVIKMHEEFNPRRLSLLDERVQRQKELDKGALPGFLPETKAIRDDLNWHVAKVPPDLQNRKVEITGPAEKKMMINAFNSGANVFMADFEDSLSPTWKNILEGQANLIDAVNGELRFTSSEGKQYLLNEKTATLIVRPRGWHLSEPHLVVDGIPVSGSLFDFALFLFHNAKTLIANGSGPYFYLPKLENHREARLWNDVFVWAQNELNIPQGTIRATVLIETITAAYEMDEILYELKDHIAGLNAGRWDYIFSIIKKFQNHKSFLFPDRGQITMTTPFMRAYAELLVYTCHKRGAHALGGMSAYIPNRKNKEANEYALKQVVADKEREVKEGFDGTWVAHPDLIPIAREVFDKHLGNKPHQKDTIRKDAAIKASDLSTFLIPFGTITEAGLRQNINVAMQYLDAWLRGFGAVSLFNLMEDTATAEISRAQLWQWLHHFKAILENGLQVTPELFKKLSREEFEKIQKSYSGTIAESRLNSAQALLESLVLSEKFEEFLTWPAYHLIQ
jgi:malate synthase